jgi:hypothetical protein
VLCKMNTQLMRIGRWILLSLPLSWLALTLLYVICNGVLELPRAVPLVVNLFVPYGIWNYVVVQSTNILWLHALISIIVLSGGEYLGTKWRLAAHKKIVFNLSVLFLWTTTVEWLLWGNPCSAMALIRGHGCVHF